MAEKWIKALGMGARERQLRDDWLNERDGLFRHALTFSRRPGFGKGDEVVLYAAGKGLIFGIGKVVSFPFLDDADESAWPWRVNIELDASRTREFLHEGEPLEALSVDERDLRKVIKRRSHLRLSGAEFQAAVKTLGSRSG